MAIGIEHKCHELHQKSSTSLLERPLSRSPSPVAKQRLKPGTSATSECSGVAYAALVGLVSADSGAEEAADDESDGVSSSSSSQGDSQIRSGRHKLVSLLNTSCGKVGMGRYSGELGVEDAAEVDGASFSIDASRVASEAERER